MWIFQKILFTLKIAFLYILLCERYFFYKEVIGTITGINIINNYTFNITYDMIVLALAGINIATVNKSLTSYIVTLCLFDSIFKVSSLVYSEYSFNAVSEEEEHIRFFRRSFQLFVPAVFSQSIKEFLAAGYNIAVSEEFFRLTLSIVNLCVAIYMGVINLAFGEEKVNKDMGNVMSEKSIEESEEKEEINVSEDMQKEKKTN